MSAPAEKIALPPPSVPDFTVDVASDRRADVETKQSWVASLLEEINCDGLLVLEPENFGWLSSGGAAQASSTPNRFPFFTLAPSSAGFCRATQTLKGSSMKSWMASVFSSRNGHGTGAESS